MKTSVVQENKIDIGIEGKKRGQVAERLNLILADEFVLYVKARNFHWNVNGPNFHEMHKFFETLYERLNESVDEIAERVRTLNERPFSSLAEFSRHTRLNEKSGEQLSAPQMIEDLLHDYEEIIRVLRQDLEDCISKWGDAGTGDFLTGLMKDHEKEAWILRSSLPPQENGLK